MVAKVSLLLFVNLPDFLLSRRHSGNAIDFYRRHPDAGAKLLRIIGVEEGVAETIEKRSSF